MYILNRNNEPVKVSPVAAARWRQENEDRWRVAYTDITAIPQVGALALLLGGDAWVSTVLLMSAHGAAADREGVVRPIVFETLVSAPGSDHDGEMRRYTTWDDALSGHSKTVAAILRDLGVER
jgi:hypothetical protein